jgi:transcription termination/antitermination protein NusA
MVFDLDSILGQISKDKRIARKILVDAMESAMLSAARKHFGHNLNLEARYNDTTGEVDVFMYQVVVSQVIDTATQISLEKARVLDPQSMIGDELGQRLETAGLGRIAAQTARQVIAQKLRDAERGVIFDEFKESRGELISGIVQRYERGNVIVNLGRTEAMLPKREQIPNERYRQGDRIKGVILDVDPSGRGPQIILSRSHNSFLIKLFEEQLEDDITAKNVLEIKAAAREPGSRAKIAVYARDNSIDPIGACVGIKGSRVLAVGQELKGEKIDIIAWTADEPSYIARSLAPAEVSRVVVDEDNRSMLVVVEDNELSKAIGRRGENVKLASRLTGWKLDVRSVSAAEEESRAARRSLDSIPGIAFTESELLFQEGFQSLREVANATMNDIKDVLSCTEERAQKIIDSARLVHEENDKSSIANKNQDAPAGPITDLHQLVLAANVRKDLLRNGINSIQAVLESEDSKLEAALGDIDLVQVVRQSVDDFLSTKKPR